MNYENNDMYGSSSSKSKKMTIGGLILAFLLIAAVVLITFWRYSLASKAISLRDKTTTAIALSPEIAASISNLAQLLN